VRERDFTISFRITVEELQDKDAVEMLALLEERRAECLDLAGAKLMKPWPKVAPWRTWLGKKLLCLE
jgi:hypothetical protein